MPNYSAQIKRSARKWGVNPRILTAMLRQESGLREGVTSPAGARDIAQFMPATAKAYGVRLGDGKAGDDIDGAAHYLHDNLKRTGGDYRGALSIYNSGRPDAYKDPHFANGQTYNYVKSIMSAAGGAPQGAVNKSHVAGTIADFPSERTRTVTDKQARTAAILSYFHQQGKPGALVDLVTGLQDAQTTETIPGAPAGPQNASQAPHRDSAPYAGKLPTGVANFEGKAVAAWIKPALQYARQHGWKGAVNSGYRSDAEQKRIYDSGVRPAARPRAYGGAGSNHEFKAYPGGAVDVSDAESLAKILKGSKWGHLLKWAGSKDPVHFSHPHNGSY